MRNRSWLFLAVTLGGWAALLAVDPPVPPINPPPTNMPTHTIARGALQAVQVDAVFASTEMQPIKLDPKVWMDLTVLEVVPHGARVKRGDVLIKLDTEKLRDQIEDLEQDRTLATVALELGSAELENLQKATPLRLDSARRFHRGATEDLAYFEKTGRDQKEKSARFNVKSAEQRLQNAQEELNQLKKMYRADDLTEKTEEIILKRQKFAVEAAEYGLEATKQGTDWSLNTALPREAETLKAQKRDQDLALAWSEETLPKGLLRKQLEIEKLKRDQKKNDKKLANFKNDLETLTVRAPMDGLVYYGTCENGRWPTAPLVAKKLVPGGKLSPQEIILTMVNPDRLVLLAVVPENDLSRFKRGLEGKATAASAPDQKFSVKLEEMNLVPLTTGGFGATISLRKPDNAVLLPGMTAKVVFGESRKRNPLVAPKETILTDDNQSHVTVLTPDGQPQKRAVKLGESDGKMVEILGGLAEGEKILLKPNE